MLPQVARGRGHPASRSGVLITRALPVLTLLLAATPATADTLQDGWVCLDGATSTPTPPSVTVMSSNPGEVVLRVTTPGILCETVTEDTLEFHRITAPGCYHSPDVGYACVPLVGQLIAVPEGSELEVSVSVPDSADTVYFPDAAVYPTPALVVEYTPEGWEYLVEEFALEEGYYDTGYYPGDVASVGGEGSLRGQGVARVTVYPLQYDGSTSELVAYPELLVTITCSGGRGGLGEPTGPLSRVADLVLPNYEGEVEMEEVPADTGKWDICHSLTECCNLDPDYLMIVEGSLMDSVGILAKHRSLWNGYNVAVVPDTTVIEHADTSAISDRVIKKFIRDVYDDCTAEHMTDGRLGYVLLVGDAESDSPNSRIPAHEAAVGTDMITTDHWYACVAGDDDYADVMLGRLATSHLSEFVTEAHKIRYYEVNASSADDWRDNALLSCGFAWAGCDTTDEDFAESTHDAFDDVAPAGYSLDQIHAHELAGWNCTDQYGVAQDTTGAWVGRMGYHFIELCSHGYPGGTYAFEWWDADTLHNGDKLGFWMTYSCSPGAFDWVSTPKDSFTDCLGERLLHNSGMNGAIGFFGAAETVSWSWTYLGRYMWEAFFDWDLYRPGEAIAYAKLWNLSWAGYDNDHLKYNLLGDPAIDLFLVDSEGYGTYPDYVVRSSEVLATPSLPSCGEEVALHARVHNVSNCRVDDEVKVLFQMCEQDGSECSLIDSFLVHVPAWGWRDLDRNWTPGAGDIGHRAFRVVVDPDSLQQELHEGNNDAVIDVGVVPNKAGFPVDLGGVGGLSPVVVDVDSDADPEIVAAARDPGRVRVLSASGDPEWSFDAPDARVLRGPPSCGDLGGDGAMELAVCYDEYVSARRGADGEVVWTRSVRGLNNGAILADVSGGDGKLELLVTRAYTVNQAMYCQMRALTSDGSDVEWAGPAQDHVGAAFSEHPDKSGAAGDLNGDGLSDPVYTYSDALLGCGAVALSGADGGFLWDDYAGDTLAVLPCDPVVADVVPDSTGLDVLWGSDVLRCLSSGGDPIWDSPLSGCIGGLAVSHLGGDSLGVVAATYGSAGDPDDCEGHLYILSGADGDTLDSVALDYAAKAAPIISDLDGDGQQEVLVTSSCYEVVTEDSMAWVSHLDAFTFTAADTLARFSGLPRPLLFWGELTSSPCVADVDEDGKLDIVLIDGDGLAHCLESSLWGGDGESPAWVCYQHDERHTGLYEMFVSGPYPAQTTASWWGDYILTGDVTVDTTSSLVIQPGATVRAVAGADDQSSGVDTLLVELIVHGELEAGGDPLRQVVFTSDSASPLPSDWRGIRLREGSTGVIDDVTISYAEQAIDAYKPDALSVRDSDILSSDVRGLKCTGNPGVTDSVVVHGNTVEGGIIGMELNSCTADVGSNTITGCSSYGMKIYYDRGSSVHENVISRLSYASGAFAGIYVVGSMESLLIADNIIGDEEFAPSIGIGYEASYSTDAGVIEGNMLSASNDLSSVKGMYFYNAKPTVRRNSLEGEAYYAAFWVGGSGTRPNLGMASGGQCGACGDSVSSGCNRVVPESITWGVKVEEGSSNTVWAQCNWWGEAYCLFSSVVVHSPSLDGDPWGRGGEPVSSEPDVPLAATLLQNVPNPFNPDTVFRFGLPQAGAVKLDIYDLTGRHVRTLVDGTVGAGWQTVVWDGRGERGERAASGVYFCRFEAEGVSESRKVVILK